MDVLTIADLRSLHEQHTKNCRLHDCHGVKLQGSCCHSGVEVHWNDVKDCLELYCVKCGAAVVAVQL